MAEIGGATNKPAAKRWARGIEYLPGRLLPSMSRVCSAQNASGSSTDRRQLSS